MPRNWRGALFGKEPELWSDYVDRIRGLVADRGTHLYFDTSFLMLLAKLGPSARQQFMDWSAAVGGDRFHVPLWSAHEFFKHRLLNTVATELTGDITKFDKAAKQLYRSLHVYASDQLFGFVDSGAMVLDEFQRTIQPLRATLRMAASSKVAATGVQDVSTFIDALLLPGSLDELMADIESDERVRNRGAVPPAFRDAHKRTGRKADDADDETPKADNSFGDLVFWREVLRHAKRAHASAVIVISKDRKNDWYEKIQGDAGLTPELRTRVTDALPVPAAHPLLVREAHDLGAGALDLIDPMYCGVLLEAAGTGYASFAAAVMRPDLPEPATGKKHRKWKSRFGPDARVLGGGSGGVVDEEELEPDEDDAFDSGSLVENLLRADHAPDPAAAASFKALTEGDLATRSDALSRLDAEQLSEWTVHDLAALGGLVTDLAQGDMPAASDFLSNLRDLGPEIPARTRLPIFFGALGSLYLDRELHAVRPRGARIALTLLDMSTAPEMREATTSLASVLDERGVRHAIGGTDPIELEVVTLSSADNKSRADLVALKVNGENLITDAQDEVELRLSTLLGRPGGAFDSEVGALIDIVARYRLLPRQLLVPSSDADAMVRVSEYAGIETED